MPAEPWFLVSKPLRPPFDDGSSVLVRDLVAAMPTSRPLIYFGDPDAPLRSGDRPIPAAPMGHSPSLAAKARVLAAIVHPARRRAPLHFFFTPNPITSSVVAALRRLQPGRPVVQSLMSAHDATAHVAALRRLDRVVVLSDHTRRRLVEAGLAADRVVRIHPAVREVEASEPPAGRRLLYAGDLDEAAAARLIAIGRATTDGGPLAGWSLVVACRPKHAEDARARMALLDALGDAQAEGRFELHGRVDDMDALVRGCTVQLFVTDHVHRKVDLPLVLLEGLARGLPLVALDFAPVREIFERARERGLEVGVAAPADAGGLVESLAAFVADAPALLQCRRDAPALIQGEFSLDAMARAYASLHDELYA